MKYGLITILIATALTACGQQKQDAQPIAEPVSTAVTCPETDGYRVFPAGLSIDLPYHLRSDRIIPNEKGERRRVVIEYLEGDAATALTSIAGSLEQAGFAEKSRKDVADGVVSAIFSKKGVGLIYVRITADPGKNPSHPAAKGLAQIGYPTGEAI